MGAASPRGATQRLEVSSRRQRTALEDPIASWERPPDAAAVESSQTPLQTDSGGLHAERESDEITTLPLGTCRHDQTPLNLVPGTTPARFQNAVIVTSARDLASNVNGTAHTNKRFDGATNVDVFLPHHAVCIAPSETVSAVHISTAQLRRGAGDAGP